MSAGLLLYTCLRKVWSFASSCTRSVKQITSCQGNESAHLWLDWRTVIDCCPMLCSRDEYHRFNFDTNNDFCFSLHASIILERLKKEQVTFSLSIGERIPSLRKRTKMRLHKKHPPNFPNQISNDCHFLKFLPSPLINRSIRAAACLKSSRAESLARF